MSLRRGQNARQRARSEDALEQLWKNSPQVPPKVSDIAPPYSRREQCSSQRARSAGAIAQLRTQALQLHAEALVREAEDQCMNPLYVKSRIGSTDEQERSRLRRERSQEKLQQLISRVEDLRVRAAPIKDAEKERLDRSLANVRAEASDATNQLLPEDVRQIAASVFKSIVNLDVPAAVADTLAQVESYGWASVKWRRGVTLLHWAAGHGMPDLCKHVIRLGANPFATDDDCRTPIDHARLAGHDHVFGVLQASEIRQLTDRISCLAEEPTKSGQLATLSPRGAECLELVKSRGWQSITWARGHTLLHVVARKCLPGLCFQLLQCGADMHHRNDAGKCAHDYLGIVPQGALDVHAPESFSPSLPAWMTLHQTQACGQRGRSSERPSLIDSPVRDSLSSAVSVPFLVLNQDRSLPVMHQQTISRSTSCKSMPEGRREDESPCLSSTAASHCLSDLSPQPSARIRSIRFRGSASLESVHFIDTDAPADLHLSVCQGLPIKSSGPDISKESLSSSPPTCLHTVVQRGRLEKNNSSQLPGEVVVVEQPKTTNLEDKRPKPCPRRQLSCEVPLNAGKVMARVAQIEQRCQSSMSRPSPKVGTDVRRIVFHRPENKLTDRRLDRFFTVQVAGG